MIISATRIERIILFIITITMGLAGAVTVNADDKLADVKVFTPHNGDHVGLGGRGWLVDLALTFDTPLEETGFSGFQITGPGAHNDVQPFPGTFSPGRDDRLPGLVVLLSTTSVGAGPGLNLANLFNLTGIAHLEDDETELWDTWIIGAPNFGVDTSSTLYVAVVNDLDGNGVFDDAPDVITDYDADGDVDEKDLKALGLASNVRKVRFFINP